MLQLIDHIRENAQLFQMLNDFLAAFFPSFLDGKLPFGHLQFYNELFSCVGIRTHCVKDNLFLLKDQTILLGRT